MSSLAYSYLDWSSPVAPPPRMVNGGLYTGEAAKGEWGNVPVIPEAHIIHTQNLRSANPPPGAEKQAVSEERPGNNSVQHPFHISIPNYQFKVINNAK